VQTNHSNLSRPVLSRFYLIFKPEHVQTSLMFGLIDR
jgi:hypothetical protein